MKDNAIPDLEELRRMPPEQLLAMRIQTFKPAEVSPIFGVGDQTLRDWMRHGCLHIGVADLKETSENKWNYTIFRPHLERCIAGLIL